MREKNKKLLNGDRILGERTSRSEQGRQVNDDDIHPPPLRRTPLREGLRGRHGVRLHGRGPGEPGPRDRGDQGALRDDPGGNAGGGGGNDGGGAEDRAGGAG